MSVEERIALLESQKLAYVQHCDEAIRHLQGLRGHSAGSASCYPEPEDTVPAFRPIVADGKFASAIILEERGQR